jgi:lactate permease
MGEPWLQVYDPLHNTWLSTIVAALPVLVLLGSIAVLRIRIHFSALLGLGIALLAALAVYRMPAASAFAAAGYGAAFGLFPIGWIILNVIFLFQLTVERGHFERLHQSLAKVAPDPRVQIILIAFSFGAFIEGVSGFGTPVAITGAILMQLGFKPLHASGLALIANTAPVAFGSLGIPITTLAQVTGLDVLKISAMVGRQLPFFSLLVPFWVVAAYAGWRGLLGVWPAALTAGLAFAVPQFFISNFHGPWLVDIISAASSMVALVGLLRVWQPKAVGQSGSKDQRQNPHPRLRQKHYGGQAGPLPLGKGEGETLAVKGQGRPSEDRRALSGTFGAWMPWVILTGFILVWGLPQFKTPLERAMPVKWAIPHLHNLVQRGPAIVPPGTKPEAAELKLNLLSATGTAIGLAGLAAGLMMGFGLREMGRVYALTIWRVRYSLLTIAAMLALGTVTKYSGTDATLGLALAHTGSAYPFFGTMLGWLGVALTGSDTASNVLFGGLQKITAEQTGLSPILMAAANSSGGVMGKMVDAQSIVVASTATNWYGHEGSILRYVFFHSIALAALVGVLVLFQAYVFPFYLMVLGVH